MSKGAKNKVIPFPGVKIQYNPLNPKDLDNLKLDEIKKSIDDIVSLLNHMREDLMLVRMRIKGK